jgi:hypothetical protein
MSALRSRRAGYLAAAVDYFAFYTVIPFPLNDKLMYSNEFDRVFSRFVIL